MAAEMVKSAFALPVTSATLKVVSALFKPKPSCGEVKGCPLPFMYDGAVPITVTSPPKVKAR